MSEDFYQFFGKVIDKMKKKPRYQVALTHLKYIPGNFKDYQNLKISFLGILLKANPSLIRRWNPRSMVMAGLTHSEKKIRTYAICSSKYVLVEQL